MKRVYNLFVVGLILTMTASCGNSKHRKATIKERSSSQAWEYKTEAAGGFDGGRSDLYSDELVEKKAEEKKVIFNGNLSLAVENPDTTNAQLEVLVKKYKGYVTELGSSKSVIRVKHYNLKAAMTEIEAMGKVQRKHVAGKDVTNQYLDYEIRLENAEKARSRYLALLDKAENVKAALLVEKELERLNGTIDMLKGQMTRIDHLAEFSTITVYIKERKKPGILGYIGLGLYHSVKWLFVRN